MAVIRTFGQLSTKLLIRNKPSIYVSRTASSAGRDTPWYEYWDVGPYPVTKEDYRKAAEKYNMHPDEYKPYPEEYNRGDYPMLPKISADLKDPFYPWDMPSLRRNYNEPVHHEFHCLGHEQYPYGARHVIEPKWYYISFFGVVGTLVLLTCICGHLNNPVLEKQYPRNGPHYTFEPAK